MSVRWYLPFSPLPSLPTPLPNSFSSSHDCASFLYTNWYLYMFVFAGNLQGKSWRALYIYKLQSPGISQTPAYQSPFPAVPSIGENWASWSPCWSSRGSARRLLSLVGLDGLGDPKAGAGRGERCQWLQRARLQDDRRFVPCVEARDTEDTTCSGGLEARCGGTQREERVRPIQRKARQSVCDAADKHLLTYSRNSDRCLKVEITCIWIHNLYLPDTCMIF